MPTFTLDRDALLGACAAAAGKSIQDLNLADMMGETNAETLAALLRRANAGNAIRGPHPSLSIVAYPLNVPDMAPSALVGIRDEVGNLQLSGIELDPQVLHHAFTGPRSALGPTVLCEIVEAVLDSCSELLTKLIGGYSLFSIAPTSLGEFAKRQAPFTLMTIAGRPMWLTEGEPAATHGPDAYYLTEYRLRVLSEHPIPGEVELPEVLGEANGSGGSYVAKEEQVYELALTAERCAALLVDFDSDPGFFGIADEDGEDDGPDQS
jgi:hypothetical protein